MPCFFESNLVDVCAELREKEKEEELIIGVSQMPWICSGSSSVAVIQAEIEPSFSASLLALPMLLQYLQ